MNKIEIRPGIFWVGAIDWDIRSFHGYLTQRGTSYNAYLIMDEKVILVDTVKSGLFDEMLSRIKEIVDPSKIDYIVSNHVEMDHSGSVASILDLAPKAKVITSPKGEKGLCRHYRANWDFHIAQSGDTMSIGKHTLHFVHIPMVHWPDSMVTYIPEERLLLPNDAFGQHLATPYRFDDEVGWAILKEEAAKYFGNIVLVYAEHVKRALNIVSGLDVEMIAPSHGVIWRSFVKRIIEEYSRWASNETIPDRALIVYDSMWGSTEKMAYNLQEGLLDKGIKVTMRSLKSNHISDIMTDVLMSRLVAIGSPTLNNGLLPSVASFLSYLKGLRPGKRLGFAFGSYGWGGQGVGEIERVMQELKWEMPADGIRISYIPNEEDIGRLKDAGRELGRILTC